MTETLQQHIQQLLPGIALPWQVMAPLFETRTVPEGTLLLKENEACSQIYFVNKGCLYLFYDNNNRQEVIHFALENWWLTDYKTFSEGEPAVYGIAAMEDTEVTILSRESYEQLQERFPAMARYFNKIHERAYGAALLKQKTFATVAKPDFYRYFRTTYPVLIQRIPDAVFASYMGVSDEELLAIKADFVS